MRGSATYWAILLVVVIIVAAVLSGMWPKEQSFEEATGLIDVDLWHELKDRAGDITEKVGSEIDNAAESAFERQLIDAWLVAEGLNQYGDPSDTAYAGGSPLFDEQTGKTVDRHEYIMANYPDKPWRN